MGGRRGAAAATRFASQHHDVVADVLVEVPATMTTDSTANHTWYAATEKTREKREEFKHP
jgi:hypothetical protein